MYPCKVFITRTSNEKILASVPGIRSGGRTQWLIETPEQFSAVRLLDGCEDSFGSVISVYSTKLPARPVSLKEAGVILETFDGSVCTLKIVRATLPSSRKGCLTHYFSGWEGKRRIGRKDTDGNLVFDFTRLHLAEKMIEHQWEEKVNSIFVDDFSGSANIPGFGRRTHASSSLPQEIIRRSPLTPKGWRVIGSSIWRFPPNKKLREKMWMILNDCEDDIDTCISMDREKVLSETGEEYKRLFSKKVLGARSMVMFEDIDWLQWALDTLAEEVV